MTRHWKHMDREARIAAVVRLRDLGHSRTAIAAELRVTVNSLHGFVFRQQIDGIHGAKARTGGWYDLDTPVKVGRMKEMIAAGKSTSDISAEIGITTPAVRRFCWEHRIGVSDRVVSFATPAGPPLKPDTRPLREDAWEPLGEPVGLLSNDGCCWPVDGGWCGKPKAKRSYCEHHHAIAYPRKAQTLTEEKVRWLVSEDDRADNRALGFGKPDYIEPRRPSARPTKREAVRYDDHE